MSKEARKNKNSQRKALLSLIYQPELFDHINEQDIKESKEFRDFITEEAKERGIDSLELIDYFAENRDELIKLLRKKNYKKFIPKLDKIYSPAGTFSIYQKVATQNKLTKNDLINQTEDSLIYQKGEMSYFYPIEKIEKIKGDVPKVYISQDKNLNLLLLLTQEQQFLNTKKEAKCKFTLAEYARRRGHSDDRIEKSGKIFEELKKDLFSGAYTTYMIESIMMDGKEYKVHGIPNFYRLYEPINPKSEWIVEFNAPYNQWVLEVLNGQAKQFYIYNPKEIEDPETSKRPYLHLFYREYIKMKRQSPSTMPIKVINLLTKCGIGREILERPKECFRVLKEFLIYFSTHYEPVPEIESFNLYSDFHKTQAVKLPLSISEAFKQYSYEDFNDLLIAVGIKDIRDTYISFTRPRVKADLKLNLKLTEEENNILEKTLKWFEGKVTIIPPEDQESQLKMYIKKLGIERYRELFNREANKYSPNALEFLTKVLPFEKDKLKDLN
jgi:hypothetical protein